MTKRQPELQWIAITLEDGHVIPMSFVTRQHSQPVPWDRAPDIGWRREATPLNVYEEIKKSGWATQLKSWRFIEFSDIPTDRMFRPAWRDNGKAIAPDIDLAREIWRNVIREARAVKLAELDVAYMRADEIGDLEAKQVTAAQKRRLRDAPNDPAIDKAKTIEELKAVWPAALR